MKHRGGARERGLNRHLQDASLGERRRQLAYKLPEGRLILADRSFASSKRCSSCGSRAKTSPSPSAPGRAPGGLRRMTAT